MTEQGLDKKFWERRWEAARRGSGPRPTAPNRTLTDAAAALPNGSALDAGCGEGADAIWLAQRGWNVTAVDFVDSALQNGRARADEIGAEVARRIEWRQADLSEWAPPVRSFDLVSAHYVHGITQRHRLFGRLAAAVRPGGTLLIVGHHPANADIVGSTMPGAVFFTTDDVAAALDEGWEPVVVDDDVPRHTVDAEGRPITLRCAVFQARRGPAALAG
ncbi:class I SAM-dependent methyltransferase [Mycolicibacterium tusciae]|uniref:class I SAM-dependent methyltransferase n=1 Tax=Mycolicibacterium tusciae TaxID=75922 RepID=UPI00024A46DE|nr:class I SAM-dependent methyltransferase [Mycolicibacterium tusciae]